MTDENDTVRILYEKIGRQVVDLSQMRAEEKKKNEKIQGFLVRTASSERKRRENTFS
jgi:hypothetical protein